jgi:hypothetical protein
MGGQAGGRIALTAENYYSLLADRQYMSCSQWDSFSVCEAREDAYLRGKYDKPEGTGTALLVGSYFHAAMEGKDAFEAFCAEHWNDIYRVGKKDKRPEFEQADRMIETVRSEPVMRRLLEVPGSAEKIMTGSLFGIPWKVRLDRYCPREPRTIIDWKTVASLNEWIYNDRTGRSERFIRRWGYDRRAAVYIEIERQHAEREHGHKMTGDALFLLACVSKQTPPNRELFVMNDRGELDRSLARMAEKAIRYQRIKNGEITPSRCEECDYCRGTKRLSGAKLFTVLDSYEDHREEAY